MRSIKDYFGSLFGGRKADDAAKPSIKNPQAEIPRRERPVGPSHRKKAYKGGDIIGGQYEVYGTLGMGGFGFVYLTYDHVTEEVVALKTFRDEFLADGKTREAFKKEALIWVNLERHPFILPALLVFEDKVSKRLYVCMDYIAPDQNRRVNLADHLEHASDPIDTETALRWAIQFCYGMEHVNANGIKCHRDIKPANIMITQDGTLKITDFGLAAAAQIAWGGGVSFVGSGKDGRPGYSLLATEGKCICGTPGYIPPEIHRGEGADVRSDIYSFGLVLWQIASGSVSPPFHVNVPHRGSYEEYIQQYVEAVYRQQMTGNMPFVDSPMKSIIERCLTVEPSKRYANFTELRNELASVYYSRTHKAVEVPPFGEKTATFWNNKGFSLNSLGRYDEAIDCCNKALEIDPQEANAWYNKGCSLGSLGRYDEAIDCYNKALDIYPRDAHTWGIKGIHLNTLGRYDDAIDCYNKALEINLRDANAWINKGVSLRSLGHYDEAIDCCNKALEIDPQYADAWSNKGDSLRSLGRNDEAIDCYNKAIAIDPRDDDTWNNKGNSLQSLGRYDEATDCYNKALDIDPRNAIAWRNKGNSLQSLGRYDESIDCYNKALDIDPRDAHTWGIKGIRLNTLGRYDEAIDCFNKALDINPRDAIAWNNKGLSLGSIGRIDETIDCYNKALDIDPRDAIAWYNKGNSLQSLGRYDEATDCYDKALVIDSRKAAAWNNKAVAEEKLGRTKEALKSYNKFIEYAPAQYAKQIARARQRIKELE